MDDELKEAHTSHRQLSDKAARAERERDELYTRFAQGVKDIKHKSEYKNVVGGGVGQDDGIWRGMFGMVEDFNEMGGFINYWKKIRKIFKKFAKNTGKKNGKTSIK